MQENKKNRGEWGEFYAFLKLLVDGVLVLVHDTDTEERTTVPVTEINREEGGRTGRYFLNRKPGSILVENDASTEAKPKVVSIEEMDTDVKEMFKALKAAKGRTFRLIPAERLMTLLNTVYVNTRSRGIEDFKIRIGEAYMGKQDWGFSVKAMTGGKPTLFNASKNNTNAIYELVGPRDLLNPAWLQKAKSQKKLMQDILASGFNFKFTGWASDIFKRNLSLLRSEMPNLLAAAMLGHYCGCSNKLSELIDDERVINFYESWIGEPLDSDTRKYAIKTLLLEMALGLRSTKAWSGNGEMEGGVLLVLPDGKMEGYIARSINRLKDYLLESTMLDSPSRKRHEYGVVYQEGEKFFIKLNLQIRFEYNTPR